MYICPSDSYCDGSCKIHISSSSSSPVSVSVWMDNIELGGGEACSCGANRTSSEGSDSSDDCICIDGTFGINGANLACSICESGYYCPSGSDTPEICPVNYYCPSGW
jgi:hypothetical protein